MKIGVSVCIHTYTCVKFKLGKEKFINCGRNRSIQHMCAQLFQEKSFYFLEQSRNVEYKREMFVGNH